MAIEVTTVKASFDYDDNGHLIIDQWEKETHYTLEEVDQILVEITAIRHKLVEAAVEDALDVEARIRDAQLISDLDNGIELNDGRVI